MNGLKFHLHKVSLPLLIFTSLGILGLTAGAIYDPSKLFMLVLAGFLLVVTLLFYSVTLLVDDEFIVVSYGIGLIRRIAPIHHIVNVSTSKNTGLSAIYDLRSPAVLKLLLRDGASVTLPIGNPREISNFLRHRLRDE